MSDSSRQDRGALVALVLILSTVVFLAVLEATTRHYGGLEQRGPLPNGAQNPQRAEPPQGGPEFQLFGDTMAQWLMAIFSIVATGVSWRAVVLVRKTWEETKRTADAAVEANFAAQRTWLKLTVTAAESVRVWADSNGDLRLIGGVRLEAKNIGNIPSPYVWLGADMYYVTSGYQVSQRRRREMMDRLAVSAAKFATDGRALAPGETTWSGAQSTMMLDPFEELERERMRRLGDISKPRLRVFAHCWVIYGTVGSEKLRHTSLLAELRKKNGTEWNSAMGDVPPDQIEIGQGLPAMT